MKDFQGFRKSCLLFTKSLVFSRASGFAKDVFVAELFVASAPRRRVTLENRDDYHAGHWLIPFTVTKKIARESPPLN